MMMLEPEDLPAFLTPFTLRAIGGVVYVCTVLFRVCM